MGRRPNVRGLGAAIAVLLLPTAHLFEVVVVTPSTQKSCLAAKHRPQQARAAPGVCAHAFRNNVLGLRCFKKDGEKKGEKTGNITDGMGGHNVESEPEHSMARRAFVVTTLAPLASVSLVYLALPTLLSEQARQADWYKSLFATRMQDMDDYERHVSGLKKELFSLIKPDDMVVELGAGLGPNIQLLPSSISYTAVEPNRFMHPNLRDRADKHFEFEQESLILDDIRKISTGSADVVVSTLVLCSVPNQLEMMSEILRILKDGGKFLFLEHVIEKSQGYPTPGNLPSFNWGKMWYREFQRIMSPLQEAMADGCHSNRDTIAAIGTTFSEVYYKRFNVPEVWGSDDSFGYFPIGPQVAGIAIKTPIAFEGQLAEVQFKFCAPDAIDVISLSEQDILSGLRCTGREVDKDQQPWFLKKIERDTVTGAFYKTSGPTD